MLEDTNLFELILWVVLAVYAFYASKAYKKRDKKECELAE